MYVVAHKWFDGVALFFVQACCVEWIESCFETASLGLVINSPKYDTVELPIKAWRKSISSVQGSDNVVEDELKSVHVQYGPWLALVVVVTLIMIQNVDLWFVLWGRLFWSQDT
jgi:hypothetical protein